MVLSTGYAVTKQTWPCPPEGFPGGTSGKEPAGQCRRPQRLGFDPRGWKWQPTPVFLLEESYGQRSLMGYGSLGWKESTRLK